MALRITPQVIDMRLRWKEYYRYEPDVIGKILDRKLQYFVPSDLMDRATGKPIPGQWIDVPTVDSETPDTE
jgi:hypothetical protein